MNWFRLTSPVLLLAALVLIFQNCAKQSDLSGSNLDSNQKTHIIVGTTSHFNNINFSSRINFSSNPQNIQMGEIALLIDLKSGTQRATDYNGTRQCQIDPARLNNLRELLKDSYICEPSPLPPDSIRCLAISVPDIELSNDSDSILLSPLVCNFGTYLCEGKDEAFRQILIDLRDNPPADCGN